jgi:hypothetical protein
MAELCLQFVAERAIGSDVIGWFSAGHLSHVDAVLPDGMLFGARSDRTGTGAMRRSPGVQARPPGYLRFSRCAIARVPAGEEAARRWLEFLAAQDGKPYDWRAIWGFVVNRDWRQPDSWICSELQARALEVAGIMPPLYLAANKITPVALALAVSAIPGATIRDLAP